ncbi:MAG: CocE/NonD family hydrolase [Planctomycetia bacterium]|nr:CocE/NonD family hydrolase [Planctomycetia bacterium]
MSLPSATLRHLAVVVIHGAILCSAAPTFAQGPDYLRAHYVKREYRIPMRDGARLFTAVYSPKAVPTPPAGQPPTDRARPLLMIRTQSGLAPYGEERFPGSLGPSAHFARSGYIFVYQDIRGRWMSEGDFVAMRPHEPRKAGPRDVDESTDTYDTIEWLLKNVADHNGKVGHYGTSYRGWLAAAGMIDAHPALKAVSPQAPIGDMFTGDDWHHNGALFLNHTFFYMPIMGMARPRPFDTAPPRPDYGTPDGYDFFLKLGPLSNVDTRYYRGEVPYWNTIAKHPVYDDYWKSIRLVPHLKNIKPAVLIVGGWFDAEDLYGTLLTYRELEAQSPGTASTLVMGPWTHGGWNSGDGARLGPVSFGSATADYFREKIEFPFFEHHLKGRGAYEPPEALMFETGANRWHEHAVWPPRETTPITWHFHPRGKLATEPPADVAADAAFDEYVSDPAKPVPYIDKVGFRPLPEYMAADQRFAASRPDVLTYETESLDADLTLVGPLVADLRVSTSGTDADWVVKVIDVYPANTADPQPNPGDIRLGGYQQLVRAEIMRGKFRESLEQPQPFAPHEPTTVKFTLPDVYHTFRHGHKIMVQVQSSWFPLVDRNPQTFVDIYQAKESDFRKSVQRVYRSRMLSSRLSATRIP